jgi:hypothetical protein
VASTVLATVLFAASAQAVSVPVSPVSATVLVGDEFFPVSQLIDGSGLFGPDPSRHTGFGATNWATESTSADYFTAHPAPVVLFDLGQDQALSGIALWAYTFNSGDPLHLFQANSLRDFELRFATAAAGPGGVGMPMSFVAEPPPLADPISGLIVSDRQDLLFGQTIDARYIQMTITDNYFGAPGSRGGDRVGFGEFAVFVVPEPATATLWLLGLAGFAMLRRRAA